MRQKLLSIGGDSWIENADGEHVFKVNGKALRVRKTLVLEDLDGNALCKIQERKLRVKDSMEIEGPDGDRLAMVKKAMITPLRARFDVKVENGPDLKVQGNIVDHEYEIEADGRKIAEISKRWFRVREPTASRSRRASTTSSSWRSRSPSTRWPTASAERCASRAARHS